MLTPWCVVVHYITLAGLRVLIGSAQKEENRNKLPSTAMTGALRNEV